MREVDLVSSNAEGKCAYPMVIVSVFLNISYHISNKLLTV
jgi:hypothetical protein